MLLLVKNLVVALCCVALMAAAGCGGSDKPQRADVTAPPTTAPSTATVQGRLLAVGGPEPAKPRPMAGTVTFKGAGGSTAKAPVDESGRFSIGLYPGRYQIRGSSPSFNKGAQCSTTQPTTTLTAGKTVTADVYCQMR